MDIAQKLQDLYMAAGARVQMKTWKETKELVNEAYEAGRKAERERILGLEVMRDEVIEERNYILDECADDWEKGRNSLRKTLREAIGDSDE